MTALEAEYTRTLDLLKRRADLLKQLENLNI